LSSDTVNRKIIEAVDRSCERLFTLATGKVSADDPEVLLLQAG
jgi:hypothetical protein